MSHTYRAPATLHALGFMTVAFLVATAFAPLAAAYGEEDETTCASTHRGCPEIVDEAGDVLLSQLTSRADVEPPAMAAGTPFDVVDLRSGYVPLESADAFALKIRVQGMPSTWQLDHSDRAGHADAVLQDLADDSIFDDALTYTAYFGLKGREYRAVASLAEVDASGVSHTAMSASINDLQVARTNLHQAQADLAEFAPLPAQATEALDEADSALGDALWTLESCEALACAPEPMWQAIDDAVEALNDARQTVRATLDHVLGDKIPNDVPMTSNVPGLHLGPAGIDVPATPDEINDLLSEAASLSSTLPLEDLGGHKLLFERYMLYDDSSGTAVEIPGGLDPGAGTIEFFLFKKQVGSPHARAGDLLTGFAIESSTHGNIADFAPEDGLDHAYAFQFDTFAQGPSGQPGGGQTGGNPNTAPNGNGGVDTPLASAVQVAIGGSAARSLAPGGMATYVITISNPGSTASRGIVSLSPAANGWTHQAVPLHWNLAPGAREEIRVSVSALKGAAHEQVTKVFLSPEGGQTETKEFTTTLAEASKGHASKGFPWLLVGGVAAVLAAAGVAAAVVLIRRK